MAANTEEVLKEHEAIAVKFFQTSSTYELYILF